MWNEASSHGSNAGTVVLRAKILHVDVFDSIQILVLKSPQHRQLPRKFDPKDLSMEDASLENGCGLLYCII